MLNYSKLKPFSILAAMGFIALAVWETAHAASGAQWIGYTPTANNIAFLTVPLWLACAGVLLMRNPPTWQPYLVTAGILVCLFQGIMLRIGQSTAGTYGSGIGLIFSAIALSFLMFPEARSLWAREDRELIEEEEAARMEHERKKTA